MPVRTSEGILKFLAGTDDVVQKVIMRLTNYGLVINPDTKKHEFAKLGKSLVNEEGLADILVYIDLVNNKVTQLGNTPEYNMVMTTIKRLVNSFLRNLIVNYSAWGIEKSKIDLVYVSIKHFTQMCVLSSYKGGKLKEITKGADVKEIIKPNEDTANKGGKRLTYLK